MVFLLKIADLQPFRQLAGVPNLDAVGVNADRNSSGE
jgi:hypothetical protein